MNAGGPLTVRHGHAFSRSRISGGYPGACASENADPTRGVLSASDSVGRAEIRPDPD